MWGEPRFLRRGGNPPAPAFPFGETGKGIQEPPCCRRRFSLLPMPIRPASIRTLQGSSRSGAIWGPQSQRVLPSQHRTIGLISEASVPPRPRSHPNPAIGLTQLNTESLRPLSPLPDCSSAARIRRPSPTNGAAGPSAFLPPPQSLSFLRSCHRVPPALPPTVSDPCPAPGSP